MRTQIKGKVLQEPINNKNEARVDMLEHSCVHSACIQPFPMFKISLQSTKILQQLFQL